MTFEAVNGRWLQPWTSFDKAGAFVGGRFSQDLTPDCGGRHATGDKSRYTDKQERKAEPIAEGYEKRGVSEKEAERRAWATVNKDDGGGEKAGGSGRGKETGHPAAHKGGEGR